MVTLQTRMHFGVQPQSAAVVGDEGFFLLLCIILHLVTIPALHYSICGAADGRTDRQRDCAEIPIHLSKSEQQIMTDGRGKAF